MLRKASFPGVSVLRKHMPCRVQFTCTGMPHKYTAKDIICMCKQAAQAHHTRRHPPWSWPFGCPTGPCQLVLAQRWVCLKRCWKHASKALRCLRRPGKHAR